MAGHVYSEIFLHFNWHTKGDQTLLNPAVEKFAHNYIANKCRGIKGVYFHGVGGTETHIHLAVRIEPFICPSEMVHALKGSCSHDTNEHFQKKVLDWQRGYGVVSFGKLQLPWVLEYIRKQKERRANGIIRCKA